MLHPWKAGIKCQGCALLIFVFSLMNVVNVFFESILPGFLFGGDASAI